MKSNRPRGFSLLETLIAVTLFGMIFSTVAMSLHGLYRFTRRVQQQQNRGAVLERLETQFRRDIHQADEIHHANGGNRLRVVHRDGSTIHYERVAGGVSRVRNVGDATPQRELFRLAASDAALWRLIEDDRSVQVELAVPLALPTPGGASLPLRIVVVADETVELKPLEEGAP